MKITVHLDTRLFTRRDAERIAAHIRQALSADPELQTLAAEAQLARNAATGTASRALPLSPRFADLLSRAISAGRGSG